MTCYIAPFNPRPDTADACGWGAITYLKALSDLPALIPGEPVHYAVWADWGSPASGYVMSIDCETLEEAQRLCGPHVLIEPRRLEA